MLSSRTLLTRAALSPLVSDGLLLCAQELVAVVLSSVWAVLLPGAVTFGFSMPANMPSVRSPSCRKVSRIHPTNRERGNQSVGNTISGRCKSLKLCQYC